MSKERLLQDDRNFRLELIEHDGQPAVRKTPNETTPPTRAERITNDVYGMEYFADLLAKHPQINLHVPKVYENSDGYYIREYVEGEPIGEDPDRLDELAKTLADIDRVEPYGESRFDGSNDYRKFNRSFEKWAQKPLETGIMTERDVTRINSLFDSLKDYLVPRIAHGDMSSYKHAYLQSDGKIALIDFENFTPMAARYFDVAWCYTRLNSFAGSTDIAKGFLASFMKHSEPIKDRDPKMQIAILQRTFGMQYDAYHDHLQGRDYRNRAAELLKLCLKGDIRFLYLI